MNYFDIIKIMISRLLKIIITSTFIGSFLKILMKQKEASTDNASNIVQSKPSKNTEKKQSIEFVPSNEEPVDYNNNFGSKDETIQSPG